MKIEQLPSPSFDDRKGHRPTLIILHYTGMETAQAALDRLTNKFSKVSAHYTVDENGKIYQHVAEEDRAWCVGKSFWQEMRDINARSINIEMVNKGHEFGYHKFADKQIEAVKKLCHEIMTRHEIKQVLGHSDVSPERKEDPGHLFPWTELAEDKIGVWPEISDEDMVLGNVLNITQGLVDLGYNVEEFPDESLIAFQRHYVPEVFEQDRIGEVTGLTKARLYALLSRYSNETLLDD